jgi:chemotaxis family two-component system response regulator Rcp1
VHEPLTIVLVDDNDCDQRLVAKALEESNCGTRLQVVGNGEEAISYLRGQGKYRDAPSPQLIILDLNLPRKDGRQVLAEIRGESSLKDMPVVIWTGAATTPDIDAIRQLNPTFYLTKPDDLDNYFAAILAIEEYAHNMESVEG